jgi:hypothetical protein
MLSRTSQRPAFAAPLVRLLGAFALLLAILAPISAAQSSQTGEPQDGASTTVTVDLEFDASALAGLEPTDTVPFEVIVSTEDDATIVDAECSVTGTGAAIACEVSVEDGVVTVSGDMPVTEATAESTLEIELTFADDTRPGIHTLTICTVLGETTAATPAVGVTDACPGEEREQRVRLQPVPAVDATPEEIVPVVEPTETPTPEPTETPTPEPTETPTPEPTETPTPEPTETPTPEPTETPTPEPTETPTPEPTETPTPEPTETPTPEPTETPTPEPTETPTPEPTPTEEADLPVVGVTGGTVDAQFTIPEEEVAAQQAAGEPVGFTIQVDLPEEISPDEVICDVDGEACEVAVVDADTIVVTGQLPDDATGEESVRVTFTVADEAPVGILNLDACVVIGPPGSAIPDAQLDAEECEGTEQSIAFRVQAPAEETPTVAEPTEVEETPTVAEPTEVEETPTVAEPTEVEETPAVTTPADAPATPVYLLPGTGSGPSIGADMSPYLFAVVGLLLAAAAAVGVRMRRAHAVVGRD